MSVPGGTIHFMSQVNILVIGIGPHAQRIYVPILTELASRGMPVHLAGVVDLKRQQGEIDQYLKAKGYSPKTLYLDSFDEMSGLPSSTLAALDALVKDLNIHGVVISTVPTVHKVYAQWALSHGLHILMDKPISMRKDVSTDSSQASALIKDYEDLLALYQEKQIIHDTIFSINVQRRYEYGFDLVKQLIAEVKERFNMPVTSIQAMHADGTWMFPKEVLTQESHCLFDGYGKVAHSGYHIFDMVWQLYEAGLVEEKNPDSLEILSSPLTPAGLNMNLCEEDYRNYFGSEYDSTNFSETEFQERVKNYGESDAFSIIRLLKNGENICNVSVNLLHRSFSGRSWAVPNEDRYKGNGRIKHQQFIIQQGPFQCIQIHNYQSKDSHDVDNSKEFDIGGNNHFDIYVFRNKGMFGSGESFFKISAKELEDKERESRLIVEKAKERVVIEFINFISKKIQKDDLRSNIDTHEIPVKILSGVYQSSARLRRKENPLIHIPI